MTSPHNSRRGKGVSVQEMIEMLKKPKSVKAWAVLDESEHSAIGGLTFYATRAALFEEYNTHTPKEWEENIGWPYFPVTVYYHLPKTTAKRKGAL